MCYIDTIKKVRESCYYKFIYRYDENILLIIPFNNVEDFQNYPKFVVDFIPIFIFYGDKHTT